MFSKEEKLYYKMVYYTLYILVKPIVKNCVGKLEFSQVKKQLFRKGPST